MCVCARARSCVCAHRHVCQLCVGGRRRAACRSAGSGLDRAPHVAMQDTYALVVARNTTLVATLHAHPPRAAHGGLSAVCLCVMHQRPRPVASWATRFSSRTPSLTATAVAIVEVQSFDGNVSATAVFSWSFFRGTTHPEAESFDECLRGRGFLFPRLRLSSPAMFCPHPATAVTIASDD